MAFPWSYSELFSSSKSFLWMIAPTFMLLNATYMLMTSKFIFFNYLSLQISKSVDVITYLTSTTKSEPFCAKQDVSFLLSLVLLEHSISGWVVQTLIQFAATEEEVIIDVSSTYIIKEPHQFYLWIYQMQFSFHRREYSSSPRFRFSDQQYCNCVLISLPTAVNALPLSKIILRQASIQTKDIKLGHVILLVTIQQLQSHSEVPGNSSWNCCFPILALILSPMTTAF